MQGEENEGGLVVRGRVEIDMRQPFRSVREAVMLFGEKVLAGEVYANKLKEMQTKSNDHGQGQKCSKFGAITAELEETKQSLQKAKEEGNLMALHLASLKQELEKTKRELCQLKAIREVSYLMDEPEADEELKFVENTNKVVSNNNVDNGDELFEKKRCVKFASPLLTKVINVDGDEGEKTSPSTKKKQIKKSIVPMIGRLFLKKGRKYNE